MISDSFYWDKFYESRNSIAFPSPFACTVASDLDSTAAVVDLGCGNGRDSFFLSRLGNRVLGIDRSAVAVGGNAAKAAALSNPPLFVAIDFFNEEAVRHAVGSFFERCVDSQRVFYCRFVIHSITEETETRLFSAIQPLFRAGDRFFGEFRTTEDAERPKIFGNHYRRFVDLDEFLKRSRERGFETLYSVKGVGMAKYRGEDPVVARVVLGQKKNHD
jgi:SAM-dependent methyltransferase